jgi:small subunit ribosomal protein S20
VAKRTASAKKQARAGAKRAARNRAVRSEVKTLIVKARKVLGSGGADASEVAPTTLEAIRALDRAASKGVLHPRNAARRKGRLAKQLAKVAVAAPPPAKGKKAAPAAPARKPAAAAKKK